MCLWLLTACLGLLPSNPSQQAQIIIVQGVPTPILQPTSAATMPPTTKMPPSTNATMTSQIMTSTTTAMPPGPTTTSPRPMPTAMTPAPTTMSPAPTTMSPAPTTMSPAPTTIPPAPTTMPPAPTTMPPASTTMPPVPTTMPPASTTMPPVPTTMPPAPTTMPPVPTTMPPAMTTTTPRPTSPGNSDTPTFPMINVAMNSTSVSNPLITMATLSIPFNISSTQSTIMSNNSSGGMEHIVLICDNPEAICVSNPDDNTTGQLPIDPRLGTTPSAAFRLPPITGYNTQNPTFDTAVKFPREKRSIDTHENKIVIKYVYDNSRDHRIRKRQTNCRCVPSGTCNKPTFGNGMIDIRIVTPTVMPCPAGQEYCCGSTTPTSIACGTLQTPPSPVVAPSAGQASFGEYPWQAIILTKQNDYIAGGVLIDQLNVITVIHRLSTFIVSGTAPNVKVRLGEWDAAGTYEPIPFQEYTVAKVFTHPSFNPNTLQYDIAVIRLSASVPFTPSMGSTTTINRACLPPTSATTYTGQRCWVAGWGKDMFGMQGQYQQILKEVDVPIVAPATCQTQMQTARLGPTYMLDTTSFVCAGGEATKDSCTGDGGSGLVCQVQGQWVVVGLVAWGLGCANANVPAAYVNVAALLPWIQQQVATP